MQIFYKSTDITSKLKKENYFILKYTKSKNPSELTKCKIIENKIEIYLVSCAKNMDERILWQSFLNLYFLCKEQKINNIIILKETYQQISQSNNWKTILESAIHNLDLNIYIE